MSRRRRSPRESIDPFSTVELRRDRRGVSALTRDLVLARDVYTCQQCGRSTPVGWAPESMWVDAVQVAYRVPPEEGGNNSMANLTTLCIDCLRERGLEPCEGPYDYYSGI